MTNQESLNDILESLVKNHKDGGKAVDTLLQIATLLNDREILKGGSFNKDINMGRLQITIKMNKGK